MIREDGKVVCDGCGEVIDSGWMPANHGESQTGLWFSIVEHEHYCDEHQEDAGKGRVEFRICMVCGKPMNDGMTDLERFYCHEECFEQAMADEFGQWREVEDDGCDGYYQAYDAREDRWFGTGIFYTEWY